MNYELIKKGLSGKNPAEIDRYVSYLKFLETETKNNEKVNKWFSYIKEDQLIELYNVVSIDNLSIDGETITLLYKGKLMVNYNYQAYKNRVLNVYPDARFDMQLVHTGEDPSFIKDSGRVTYSHKIADPFNVNREIIGAYCIIKCSRGEFLETINMQDVAKMRAAAKTQKIWDEWFSEMVLKSVIKRACKRHFRDLTQNIDRLDNEIVDFELINFDDSVKKRIEAASTFQELSKIYKSEIGNIKDEVKFIELLSERKHELMNTLPELKPENEDEAIKNLISGKRPEELRLIWKISDDKMQDLISRAI